MTENQIMGSIIFSYIGVVSAEVHCVRIEFQVVFCTNLSTQAVTISYFYDTFTGNIRRTG